MNIVEVVLDVDQSPPLDGLPIEKVARVTEGIIFTRIPNGMSSGKSAVSIVGKLPDGKYVDLELSMQNFEMVAAAFRGAEQRVLDQEKVCECYDCKHERSLALNKKHLVHQK